MQCEECHNHEATVHIQEIIGQKRLALHLCPECAAGKGIGADGDLQGLDVAALLLQLAKDELTAKAAAKNGKAAAAPAETAGHLECERCGLTEKEFRKHGRMGCADCYGAFRPLLLPLLAEIQRGTAHAGKRPGATAAIPPAPPPPVPPTPNRRALETTLAQAVAAEDYEKAARLRDEIRRLRSKEAP